MYVGSDAHRISVNDELTGCHFGDGLGFVKGRKGIENE